MNSMASMAKTPQIFGHRGARGEMPENSMASLIQSTNTGMRAVEIDVQNTSDGVTVLWHDHNLDPDMVRNSTGEWLRSDTTLIVETSYADLQVLDFGGLRDESTHAKDFPQQIRIDGTRITSLDDVCRWAKGVCELVLNIEIKSYADRTDWGDTPAVLAQSVYSLLQQYELAERTIVSSFDWRVLSEMRQLAPNITRGYLSYLNHANTPASSNIIDGSLWMDGIALSDHDQSLPQAIYDLGGDVWSPFFKDLTTEDLERAHKLGLAVNVWTVNDADDIQRMADMGVDGIITDYPTMARELFATKTPYKNEISSTPVLSHE